MVLFDAIGPGEHPCHWCGWPVSWDVVYRAGSDVLAERWEALIADHLDGDRANNDPANLVPSCPYDNSNRGGMARRGHQPGDFTETPPWERPLFGNVMAETHSRRKLRRLLVGGTEVPAGRPVEVEAPSAAEDKAQEALAADLYGGRVPAAGPVAGRRRPVGVLCRWAVLGVALAAAVRWGVAAGVVGVVVWWMLVAPQVRVRRRRLPVSDPRLVRGWTSWDQLLGSARPRVVLPAEAPEPGPDDDDADLLEGDPEPEEFESAAELDDDEEEGVPGDEDPGGVLIAGPWDRGMPPPPRRRR